MGQQDTAARRFPKHCGIYNYNENSNGESATLRNDILNRMKESRAGTYAQTCYPPIGTLSKPDLFSSMRCKTFYRQNINYKSDRQDSTCPFADPNLCIKGALTVSFDTGKIDSSVIGINTKRPYQFRRKTTCSPLIQHGYVRKVSDSGYERYFYEYGKWHDFDKNGTRYEVRNYTYDTWGDPVYTPAGGYDAYPYITDLNMAKSYWIQDPVFSAPNETYIGDDPDAYYYNANARSRAVACIDQTWFCSPDGTCFEEGDKENDKPRNREFNFMKWSLMYSTTYDAISLRLRDGLLAQQHVSQYMSKDLPPTQWMDEMENLFATTLARTHFDAWAIASGEGHDEPGYRREFPPETDPLNLCGLFKFRSSSYINLSWWPIICVLISTPLAIFFSLDVKDLTFWRADNPPAGNQRAPPADDQRAHAQPQYGTFNAPVVPNDLSRQQSVVEGQQGSFPNPALNQGRDEESSPEATGGPNSAPAPENGVVHDAQIDDLEGAIV
ncbi:hypothetical protein EJ08DRAFT_694069 [Tothia fuscella]|uniref:Uncharacterized protein n=1 Tax=Tothia fuscella TaxID=1048955 RepID=A0A9P4NZD5_9PEZI|nr:hypothetical protein EJ08DRAFT_694069 [Tothia fuscella]